MMHKDRTAIVGQLQSYTENCVLVHTSALPVLSSKTQLTVGSCVRARSRPGEGQIKARCRPDLGQV